MFYNSRFGRKKEPKEEITESRSDHNGSHSNGVPHSNGDNKSTPELAVFEQFERQVQFQLNLTVKSADVCSIDRCIGLEA